MKLSVSPHHIEVFKEIAVLFDNELAVFYNNLTPPERIFAYYIFRAGLPGNSILADQLHRHALDIQHIFQTLVWHEKQILAMAEDEDPLSEKINLAKFIQEIKCYTVYLWSSHCHYFAAECFNEKRTPGRLKLQTLTKENLIAVCSALKKENLVDLIKEVEESLFDKSFEPTLTVPNNIEESAINIYSSNFTDEHYEMLSDSEHDMLNASFDVHMQNEQEIPRVLKYSINGKYKKELEIVIFWLDKAVDHAKKHSALFDSHLVKSLEFLIEFFKTGDEEFFKKHSIEWVLSTSRIDYNIGFIETYRDPKGNTGFFQAEATIKKQDLTDFNTMLTDIEEQLPFAEDFKRHPRLINPQPILNASMNIKIFGTGELGPLHLTAAYCLPNYDDIRTNVGSKQIIYPGVRGLHALLKPSLAHKLFFAGEDADWLEEHDPEWKFFNELWTLQCLLHETIGHGSGKLAKHTFRANECLSCGHKKYNVGDCINVTQDNVDDLLLGYEHVIEELRAELIALFVSIKHLDDLLEKGFLASWYERIGRTELIKWIILYMAQSGLMRLVQQNDEATQVTGDHALANCTLTNYLATKGSITIEESLVMEDRREIPIVCIKILNKKQAILHITELMQEVQRIKSTGDGHAAKTLVESYGRPLIQKHFKILKDNDKLITGNVKVRAYIYPHFVPVKNESGQIIDIDAMWPKSIFEQYQVYEKLEMSME